VNQVRSNNALERTGEHRGRTVRAAALLRGPVRMWRRWSAAQFNR
jgi:hypothetical protein